MKRIASVICFLFVILVAAGCGQSQIATATVAPTQTATAIATSIPPSTTPTPLLAGSVSVPNEIHGTTIHIVLFDSVERGLNPPSEHRGVGVAGYTDNVPELSPSKWDVALRDDTGNTYKKLSIEFSGQLEGAPAGSVYFEWYFDPIPNSTQKLWLVLPDQVEIEITELLAELK